MILPCGFFAGMPKFSAPAIILAHCYKTLDWTLLRRLCLGHDQSLGAGNQPGIQNGVACL
jgi:hypothetical protein